MLYCINRNTHKTLETLCRTMPLDKHTQSCNDKAAGLFTDEKHLKRAGLTLGSLDLAVYDDLRFLAKI